MDEFSLEEQGPGRPEEWGWLIRDTGNRIRGPFKQAEIVQLIKKGQLKGKTEVSRANSYWFAIEEKTELARFLPEFNGGKPPPEQPTQMTATLTEAEHQDRGVEITQFTTLPNRKELEEMAAEAKPPDSSPEGLSSNKDQIQWLSDEFAEEFGEEFGVTISVQTDISGLKSLKSETAQAKEEPPLSEDQQATSIPDNNAKARQEMLRRATVKADTLPSEHKSFQGDRPKPIDALMRQSVKSGTSAIPINNHAMVNVPVEPDLTPKMFTEADERAARDRLGKQKLSIFAVVAGLLLVGMGIIFLMPGSKIGKQGKAIPRMAKGGEAAEAAVWQSMILFDLESAKSALADLELEPGMRAEARTFLAQAMVKKEFLFDVEGAMLSLQSAKAQVRNKRTEAEVDNLLGIYGFERDPASSLEILRRNLESYKDEPVFRYNLGLGLLRMSKPQDSIPIFDGLVNASSNDSSLAEDASLARGWAFEAYCSSGSRDLLCKRSNEAEGDYQRALTINPGSAKARLGLALFHMRRGGIKASENDFRAFLDSAPELDSPSRVVNFRKLSNNAFYAFAHAQIIELNTPNQNMHKPSPLIMAADAVISSMESRTSEAGKILDLSLTSAPGDANVLKALAYMHWKDGKIDEVVGTLKDLRERNSFATNLMLGKAYLKQRKPELAEKHFRVLKDAFPNRSEGYSMLGELLLEQPEKLEEAMSEFHLALKKDPLDLTAWRGLQHANPRIVLTPELQKNLPF